jgi:hypothetical protein
MELGMRLFHRTTIDARTIRRHGFRDTTSDYMTRTQHTGCWFSDKVLNVNEDAGEQILAVETTLTEDDIDQYEWKTDGKGYREWLIPAAVVNASILSIWAIRTAKRHELGLPKSPPKLLTPTA